MFIFVDSYMCREIRKMERKILWYVRNNNSIIIILIYRIKDVHFILFFFSFFWLGHRKIKVSFREGNVHRGINKMHVFKSYYNNK